MKRSMQPLIGKTSTKQAGDAAEDRALAHLQGHGLRLVARNYRTPGRGGGEIDLVMREPDGTFPTPEAHEAAIHQVIAAGKKVNCPTGIHAMEPHDALRRAEQGMRFIAVGSELRFMSQQAQAVLEVIKPQKEQKDVVRY